MAEALDFIEAMTVLTLQPGDKLVLKTRRLLPSETIDAIRAHVAQILPGVPVLILEPGMDVAALRSAPVAA